MSDEYNKEANDRLRLELDSLGYKHIDCIGGCFGHYEDSFCVFDINLEESIKLGAKYGQYSIFFVSSGGLGHYYKVDTEELIV